MAKIYEFPLKKRPRTIRELFPKQVYDHYVNYLQQSELWREEKMVETLYEGYPHKAPCDPIRSDMVWYVNETKKFGVWVINKSKHDIIENTEFLFGWSPFVRFSSAPPHEPVNIQNRELRNRLVWYVDEEGYGQYAVLKKNGDLWIPILRPADWRDHNKIYGYL